MASKQQQMTMKLDNNYSTDGCYNDDKHKLKKEERKKTLDDVHATSNQMSLVMFLQHCCQKMIHDYTRCIFESL